MLTEKVQPIHVTKQKPINSKKPVYFVSTKKLESKFLCSLIKKDYSIYITILKLRVQKNILSLYVFLVLLNCEKKLDNPIENVFELV